MSWARDVWPSERARLMSAHMQPIERLAAEATVEIVELNSWLEDDVKCEARHVDHLPACSFEVTHLLTSCWPTLGAERRICSASADYTHRVIDNGFPCATCGDAKETHWRIRPI